jgi:uncharacterized protein with NRDE domain
MTLAAIGAWLAANEGLVATILFLISEALGANPKFKSNGILSFILLQVQTHLKKKGAKDLTP